MTTKTRFNLFEIQAGGGVSELIWPFTKRVTPAATVTAWAKLQAKRPLDVWVSLPEIPGQRTQGRPYDDDLDLDQIREFCDWILRRPDELRTALDHQDVYHVEPLARRCEEKARELLEALDRVPFVLPRELWLESWFSPLTGG